MLPLAVSSPSLIEGGVASTRARTTRVDELVACSAMAARRGWIIGQSEPKSTFFLRSGGGLPPFCGSTVHAAVGLAPILARPDEIFRPLGPAPRFGVDFERRGSATSAH